MALLLVITPKEFLAPVSKLKDFKNGSGVTTEVVTLDSVYTTFPGRDEAEKVKRCLLDRVRDTGTRYALLVGGHSKFPVRCAKLDSTDPRASNAGYSPTDLYYADLFEADGSFDDWDRNKNGYFGELRGSAIAGTLNIDDVDLTPDVAVGRIPAVTAEEVNRYVDKVIRYESSMPRAWARRALLIATTDWVQDACKRQEEIASEYLKGYEIHRLYSAGNPCGITSPPSPEQISHFINQGVGLISYMGHGDPPCWWGSGSSLFSLTDVAALTNRDRLPVIFAAACSTSWFAKQAPYDPYVDVNGLPHAGINQGEVFSGPAPAPACLQPGPDVDSMGVHFLVDKDSGAVAYLGCITGAQPFSMDLAKYFFGAIPEGATTLGDMWRRMLTTYYRIHVPPLKVDPPDWSKVAEFHQPWKFVLFGDPSLRLIGVGPIGSVLQVTGKVNRLRINDVGTKYGPPTDELDVEVVVGLENAPDRGFGFRLRSDSNEGSHAGMLEILRHCFNTGQRVQIDYVRTGFLNGRILRVVETR